MTEPARYRTRVTTLAAVVVMVVAAICAGIGTASAATITPPQMRVRALNPTVEARVPVTPMCFPRSHRGPPSSQLTAALGACVAPTSAPLEIGPAGNPGAFPDLAADTSQLQHAFKHAEDFGVEGNWNKANGEEFQQSLEDHVNAPGTTRFPGTYRGNSVIHNLDPSTGLDVLQDPSGRLISGWRLSADQLRHVLENGKLGGG